jgi:glycogen debranching enzyme
MVALEYSESAVGASDITGSLAIREDDLTLVTEHNGNIQVGEEHGYGLYHRDCWFLSGYVIRLNGGLLTSILSGDEEDYASTMVMTNRAFLDSRGRPVRRNTVTIRRDRVIPGFIIEHISITNHNPFDVDVCLALEFEADFNDIFTIRGITQKRDGQLMTPVYENGVLRFSYRGKDGHVRSTTPTLDPAPGKWNGHICTYDLHLEPSGSHTVTLHIYVEDSGAPGEKEHPGDRSLGERLERIKASYTRTIDCCRNVGTDDLIFNHVFHRSLSDLRLLNMSGKGYVFH